MISRDGLKLEDAKVTAIKNMLKLTTKPEVLTLLVFVNYLSKFLPKLSDVSTSLRELTTDQSKFTLAKQHDEAFATIQRLVIQYLVLKFYTLTTRTLSPTEQRYATIEKESMEIVFACERFNQYLACSFRRLQSSHPSVTET